MRFILFDETLEIIYQNVIPLMLSFCPKFNKGNTEKIYLSPKLWSLTTWQGDEFSNCYTCLSFSSPCQRLPALYQ